METSNIQTFFTGLKTTLENTEYFQKANNLEYAFEFNPLIHFYNIGENKLSEMLSFFLNPNQKHGQGDIFLKSFIELDLFNNEEFSLKQKIGNFNKVKIEREKQTGEQRRLDICLEFNGQFAIGIENKIWANDQYKQLYDYNKWLNEKYSGNYILVYLTPYGHSPSEESIKKDDFVKLQKEKKIFLLDHANQFQQLINIWEQKSKADKVLNFFKDFQQLFNHKFKGNIFMNQQKTISDFILKQPKEYLGVALAVSESMEGIKVSLLQELIKQTKEIAKELGLTTTNDPSFNEYKGGINFMHSDLNNNHLRIKFLIENNNWIFGIVKRFTEGFPVKYDFQYINEQQNKYKQLANLNLLPNDFWYAYDNLFDSAMPAEVYLKIVEGEMAKIIRQKLVIILSSFNKLDPERFHFVIPEIAN